MAGFKRHAERIAEKQKKEASQIEDLIGAIDEYATDRALLSSVIVAAFATESEAASLDHIWEVTMVLTF